MQVLQGKAFALATHITVRACRVAGLLDRAAKGPAGGECAGFAIFEIQKKTTESKMSCGFKINLTYCQSAKS